MALTVCKEGPGPGSRALQGTTVLCTPVLIVFSFPQLERWGALLVEFEVPLITDPKLPAQRQNVVLEDDVIQFLPSVECSLRPGDKVLALCEPDEQRYGPGTVLLASEARDPQRGKGS